jgi:Ca2+-transporting ATPase
MSVKALIMEQQTFTLEAGQRDALPASGHQLLECAVLASEINPFDPMEQAFHRCYAEQYAGFGDRHRNWSFVHEYALTTDIQAMTHVWRSDIGHPDFVATKGAPESVARLCKLDEGQKAAMLQNVETLAAQGMRVLAVARASYTGANSASAPKASWPTTPEGFDFIWLGLVGLADPIRATVPDAIRECQTAGIRVVMITGDYPATARAIAAEAGLPCDKVITGAQLDAVGDAELTMIARDAHVFARIRPEQKLRLVLAFKSAGEIVAMTGDGVNDAPALKAAHIGIAMGERGTDVAREASSLVLLNDDFASIVHAIRLGRRIYDNLRKALTYVVAVHLPIAGMTLLPLLLGTPLVFTPVHIVFLEMIINPACAIVFEAEQAESEIMSRPPRKVDERLFGLKNVLFAVLQGLGLLTAVASVFFLGLHAGVQEGQARALAFTCLVIGSLALIVTNRSVLHNILTLVRIPNRAQWWVLGSTAVALAAVLQTPGLQKIFHFSPVSASDLISPVLFGLAVIAWFESMKRAFRKHNAI